MGVCSVRGIRSVRWGIAGSIITAWIVTLPASFALGWIIMQIAKELGLAAVR
jgi:PiT family inorganic phosphate transporter